MNNKRSFTEKLATKATEFSGSGTAFISSITVLLLWLVSGPIFNYSDSWQLVINTGTTIITFVMVFLIQRAQNKDSRAIHLKLNELVAALNGPSNRLIDAERFTEKELKILSNYYHKLAEMSKKEKDLSVSHSIEEAVQHHSRKYIKGT